MHHGDPLTDCDLGIIRYCLGLLEIVNLNSGKIRELDMGQKVCGGTPAINMLLVRSLGLVWNYGGSVLLVGHGRHGLYIFAIYVTR